MLGERSSLVDLIMDVKNLTKKIKIVKLLEG